MWSCRDPFGCQRLGFLYQKHFDEFAYFHSFCLCWRFFACLCSCVKNLYFTVGWLYLRVCFRCMACVASSWGCQWNTDDHTCSDMDETTGPNIIKHRQVSLWYQPYLWFYTLINVKQKFKNIYLISTFDAEPDCNTFHLKINKKLKSRYQLAPSCEANAGAWWISINKSADVSEISVLDEEEGFCSFNCRVQNVNDRAGLISDLFWRIRRDQSVQSLRTRILCSSPWATKLASASRGWIYSATR